MRCYVRADAAMGRAIHRLADALEKYAPPEVEIVTDVKKADLQICHIIGVNCLRGRKVDDHVLFMHCYLTAGHMDWPSEWRKARKVFSCYDLPALSGTQMSNFVQTPLGYDPSVFRPEPRLPKRYLCLMTGYVAWSEYLDMVYQACRLVGGDVIHVGAHFGWGSCYRHRENVSDQEMRDLYAQSRFVAAMRITEGFELVGLEGLACGTPAIYLDMSCYRRWFDGVPGVVWVKPQAEADVITQLVRVFRHGFDGEVRPPNFTWESIAKNMWSEILSANTDS